MSSEADCVHCRHAWGGLFLGHWALGFDVSSSHFVVNYNGQGHNVRASSRLDLSRKI